MAKSKTKAAGAAKARPRTFKKSGKGPSKRSIGFRRSTKRRPPKVTQSRKAVKRSARS